MKNGHEILTLDKLTHELRLLTINQVKLIFFEASSVKNFKDEESKKRFFNQWCGDYIERYPENFYLMIENDKLLGYLSGCLDTTASLSVLNVPGASLFQDLYIDYPAHLHINFLSDCRGKGLGSVLVNRFLDDCRLKMIKGVHLITSQGAQNVSFYRKLGFLDEIPRPAPKFVQLFMGQLLE